MSVLDCGKYGRRRKTTFSKVQLCHVLHNWDAFASPNSNTTDPAEISSLVVPTHHVSRLHRQRDCRYQLGNTFPRQSASEYQHHFFRVGLDLRDSMSQEQRQAKCELRPAQRVMSSIQHAHTHTHTGTHFR